MKKIVTIGGGHYKVTSHIHKRIVELTKKKKPKLLFIPTASSDDEKYVKYIGDIYQKLGCEVKNLFLIKQTYSKKELSDLIDEADIIYVGGGNTLMMMRKFRYLGIDKLLKKAWKSGTVMCGLSAGSLTWYESGHSDSMWYYDKKNWDYIRVRCLDILPFINCPHYDSKTGNKKRKNDFKRMLKKYPGKVGIACDDGVAIEYLDDKFRVLSAKKTTDAYRTYWKGGKFFEEQLKNTDEFLPISNLKKINGSSNN